MASNNAKQIVIINYKFRNLNANLFKTNYGNVNKSYMPTNCLTTAAMNILGLRIKTVCSNFEMVGHVLDNNLSFMVHFFEKHVA